MTRHEQIRSAINRILRSAAKPGLHLLDPMLCEEICAEIEKLDKVLEPLAYAVFMPKGHELDYKIFPTFEDAEDECILIDESLEEGEIAPKPIPLFSLD